MRCLLTFWIKVFCFWRTCDEECCRSMSARPKVCPRPSFENLKPINLQTELHGFGRIISSFGPRIRNQTYTPSASKSAFGCSIFCRPSFLGKRRVISNAARLSTLVPYCRQGPDTHPSLPFSRLGRHPA